VRRHGLQRVESRSALNVDGAPVCGGGKKNGGVLLYSQKLLSLLRGNSSMIRKSESPAS
jgi:hypothetical protein